MDNITLSQQLELDFLTFQRALAFCGFFQYHIFVPVIRGSPSLDPSESGLRVFWPDSPAFCGSSGSSGCYPTATPTATDVKEEDSEMFTYCGFLFSFFSVVYNQGTIAPKV